MRKQLCLMIGLIWNLTLFGQDFKITTEGQTLAYAVVDKESKTVAVQKGDEGLTGDVVVPSSVEYENVVYRVTTIGENAFRDCGGMMSVKISAAIDSIGKFAFYGCEGLTRAEYGSVAQICGIKFGNEYSNPLLYGHHLYIEGEEIRNLVIPDSVSSIGNDAFNGARELTSVKIPESVISIGSYAFEGCRGLESVEVPDAVVSMGNGVFYGCSGLTTVRLPASLTAIGREMFYACRNLEGIDIPATVKSIGSLAFYYCSGLKELKIPASVKSIEGSAFEGCKGLDSVGLPSGLTSITTESFRSCSGLRSITIPDSVVSIGKGAFYGCSALESVTLPAKVIYLGERAFRDCERLEEVVLPASLEIIRKEAFQHCGEIRRVECRGETPAEGEENVFDSNVYELATLYVENGNKENFAAVSPWKYFSTISEMILEPSGIEAIPDNDGKLYFGREMKIYNLQGERMESSIESLSPGLYIVRERDGVRKIIVK